MWGGVLPSLGSGEGVQALAEAAGLPATLVAAIPPDARHGGEAIVPATSRGGVIGTVAGLEILSAGLRPSVLLHGPEPWVAAVCDWARRRRLTALPSPWSFMPKADDRLSGYANLSTARRPAKGMPGEWRAVAVSPSPALAWILWLAELHGWDKVMGLALGYPPCCIEGFLRDWPEAARTYEGDLGQMRISLSGAEIPWELNVFARYAGPVLTEHFPCHWGCAASLAQARRLAAGLVLVAPALAAQIETRMRRDIDLRPEGCRSGIAHGARCVRITVTVREGVH